MAEIFRPTSEEVADFIQTKGYCLDPANILQVYPGVFSNRKVFKIHDPALGEDRVLKARPLDSSGAIESKKLNKLISSYRYSGTHFRALNQIELSASGYLIMNMPYLGLNLYELANYLDLIELGQIEEQSQDYVFKGFSQKEINQLMDRLLRDHLNFTRNTNLIHGDIFQQPDGSPNNVVYHPQLNTLFLVDAEAMTDYDDDTKARFLEQMGRTHEWMSAYLMK